MQPVVMPHGERNLGSLARGRAISNRLNERKPLFREGARCSAPSAWQAKRRKQSVRMPPRARRAQRGVPRRFTSQTAITDRASLAVVAEMPERQPICLSGTPVSTRSETLSPSPAPRPPGRSVRSRGSGVPPADPRKDLTVASVKCQRTSSRSPAISHVIAQPGKRPTSVPADSACRTCIAHPPGPR